MKEIDSLVNALKLKGYSYKTIKSYESNIIKYLESGIVSFDKYILGLIDSKKYKESTINQIINSLNFYNKNVVKNSNTINIKFLKDNKSLPEVLSKSEVKKVIDSIKNLKHKVIFTIIYSSGLRVGEVVKLKPQNVDFDRKLLHIKSGKGKKDRYTLLSNSSVDLLIKYLPTIIDNSYLFPGQQEGSHLSIRSVQQIMARQIKFCNINKSVSVHSLRHSFATHLLEQGIDIRYIQEILGHYNIKTTEVYTHVALPKINEIKNPLDF